jgi:EAL domain-containing protein (putative c-di-GMP-specific phosphodiesterase class I)
LAYLKKLPISKLKIDKSFVDNLPDDAEDAAISSTVINLAKNLNLKVIAEGVETKDQKDFLVAHGCKFIQGYYYNRPMNAKDFEKAYFSKP